MTLGHQFRHNGIPYRITGVVRSCKDGTVRRLFAERIGRTFANGRIYDATKRFIEEKEKVI